MAGLQPVGTILQHLFDNNYISRSICIQGEQSYTTRWKIVARRASSLSRSRAETLPTPEGVCLLVWLV